MKPSRRISPPAASRTRRRPLCSLVRSTMSSAFRASTVRARLIGRPGPGTIKRGVRRRRGSGVDLLPHVRATGIMAHLSERDAGARAVCMTGRRTQSRSLDDVERVRDRIDRFTRARRATGPTAPSPPAARGTACGRSASGASGCLPGSPGRLGGVADPLVFPPARRLPEPPPASARASWRPARDRCDGDGPARRPAPARQQRLGRPAAAPPNLLQEARLGRVVERRRLGRQGPGRLLPPGKPPWIASAWDEDAARGSRAEPCRPVVCTGRELASLSSAASSPGVVRRSTN